MSTVISFLASFGAYHEMSYFEIGMLVCFGASWPASVLKLLRGKTSAGKSYLFLWLIFLGYASGIAHKVLYDRDPVVLLYLFNLSMVSLDISLSYRYRARGTGEETGAGDLASSS